MNDASFSEVALPYALGSEHLWGTMVLSASFRQTKHLSAEFFCNTLNSAVSTLLLFFFCDAKYSPQENMITL